MSQGEIDCLGYLYQLDCNFRYIAPSQVTIGEKIGRCDRQVRRYLDSLEEKGLISRYQRWNNSLLYKLTPTLLEYRVRSVFAKFCRAFKFLPLWMLTVYGEIQGNVRLGLSNMFINNPLERVSHMESLKTQGGVTCPPEISPVLRSLTFVKLTKWGQIQLSCYPDSALLYAQQQFLAKKGTIKAHFDWFKSVCERYCRDKNLKVIRSKVESLSIRFPMPSGARYFIPTQESVSDNARNYYTPPVKTIEDPALFKKALSQLTQDPSTKWLFEPDARSCTSSGTYVRNGCEREDSVHSRLPTPGSLDMGRRLSLVNAWIEGKDDSG